MICVRVIRQSQSAWFRRMNEYLILGTLFNLLCFAIRILLALKCRGLVEEERKCIQVEKLQTNQLLFRRGSLELDGRNEEGEVFL